MNSQKKSVKVTSMSISFKRLIKLFFIVAFLPFYLLGRLWGGKIPILGKVSVTLFIVLFLLPLWLVAEAISGLALFSNLGGIRTFPSLGPPAKIYEPLKPKISADHIFELVNQERIDKNLKQLKRNELLDKAAQMRAEAIDAYDEFDHEATESGVTYFVAMKRAGYFNITKGENLAKDYYSDFEVVSGWMKSLGHRDNILNPEYQESGIATKSAIINSEETVLIVQLFGGYIPPRYKKEDIESWKSLISNLNSVIPSWENSRSNPGANQDELNRLIYILYRRKEIAQIIATKMESQRWLSAEESRMIEEDRQLYEESRDLTLRLNESLK